MKPPPPRTLSATPTPQLRTPRAASSDGRFPSLTLVLAGGAVAQGCADPVCGATRGDELEAHGAASAQAARRSQGADALREIGIALGLVTHPPTRPDTITPGGAPPPVVVTPPVVVPPPPTSPLGRPHISGGPVAVRPRPPETPRPPREVTPPPRILGGARAPISPHPQTPPRPSPVPPTVRPAQAPPAVTSPQPPAVSPGARRGDVAVVGAHPARRRT